MDVDLNAEVQRFGEVAGRYCGLIEGAAQFGREEFLSKARIVVAELMALGAGLPEVEPVMEDAPDLRIGVDEEMKLSERLGEKMGKLDASWQVFDSTHEEEPIQRSLGLDLAELYGDLRTGLAMMEAKLPAQEIVWSVRHDFTFHWGRHALSALTAIHVLFAEGDILVKE